MEKSWPAGVEVTAQLKREAEATAGQLGHKLTDWVGRDGAFYARCERTKCGDAAVVKPRKWRGTVLGGPALSLRCRG